MTESVTKTNNSRRFFRFSLRAAAIVLTALLCVLSYWAAVARSKRVAIEAVLRRGGRVEYWHNVVNTDPQYFSTTSRNPPVPELLRTCLGDEWFVSVVGVTMGKGSRDEDVTPLLGLAELWSVDGDLSQLTDDGVRLLSQLHSLRKLRLNDNQVITDDGVKSLAVLKNLWELDLEHTRISSQGLRDMRIEDMRNLRSLNMTETSIDDSGVALLAQLPELRVLWLDFTSVSDSSIEQISRLVMLQEVSLFGTRVSPEGIARLREMRPEARILGP